MLILYRAKGIWGYMQSATHQFHWGKEEFSLLEVLLRYLTLTGQSKYAEFSPIMFVLAHTVDIDKV